MTLEQIIQICKQLSEQHNDVFDIPVELNPRLKRTLGRVTSRRIKNSDNVEPVKMEIATYLAKDGSDEDITNVVKHEWVHYYLDKTTHINHGHDKLFKKICQEINCTGTTQTRVDSLDDNTKYEMCLTDQASHKYTIVCPHCKKVVGHRDRMCATLRHLYECSCPECGCLGLGYSEKVK